MTNPYAPADLIASKSPAFIFSDRFLPSASADSQIGPTISYAVLSLPAAFFTGTIFCQAPYKAGRIKSFIAPSIIAKFFSS